MLDLSNDAYIFSQALDNNGDAEYWSIRKNGEIFRKLNQKDEKLRSVRRNIDETMASGSCLFQGQELACWVVQSGVGVISIKPTTLDAHGRISPVLILFNIYAGMQSDIAVAVRAIPHVMQRKLSLGVIAEIEKLQRVLKWPRALVFLSILFNKIYRAINGILRQQSGHR